jgi:hypothetical protein
VAIHAPAKGWEHGPAELASTLATRLPDAVRSVVVHPESLGDPRAFAPLAGRALLENMDSRKPDARTVEELAPYFAALPQAGFCFDIAHASLVDPSMRLAHELLDAYGPKLGEVHLSSILDDGTHVPLRGEDVARFRPVLERCGEAPWILEAPLPGDQKIA